MTHYEKHLAGAIICYFMLLSLFCFLPIILPSMIALRMITGIMLGFNAWFLIAATAGAYLKTICESPSKRPS